MPEAEPTTEERIVIAAKVSPDAAKGWRRFCDANGISLASMLEVAGLDLAEEPLSPTTKVSRRMVTRARGVDRARRDRKRS